MIKPKVCLLYPRLRYISGDPPLGLGYLAAYIKEKKIADIDLVDSTFNHSHSYVYSRIRNSKPDILGVYLDSIMYNDAVKIIRWARQRGIFVVVGGPHPTIAPDTIINKADVAVLGEGEKTFTDVISHYEDKDFSGIPSIWWHRRGEMMKNPASEDKQDIDTLPFADRAIFDMPRYLSYWNYLDNVNTNINGTTMITSRGCPYKCSYCQPTLDTLFGKRLRRRSARNVIDEMKWLKENYRVKGIFFHDDTFSIDKAWIMEFCEELDKRGLGLLWGCNARVDSVNHAMLRRMYEAGLRSLHLGIESGSQRILDTIYQKRITLNKVREVVGMADKIGISTMGFFMLGAPTETRKEITSTINLARRLPLEEATFSITNPLIETYLYDIVMKLPAYTISRDFANFDYYNRRALKGGNISYLNLKWLQRKALLLFYFSPLRYKYILRHFISLNGIMKIIQKIRRFI